METKRLAWMVTILVFGRNCGSFSLNQLYNSSSRSLQQKRTSGILHPKSPFTTIVPRLRPTSNAISYFSTTYSNSFTDKQNWKNQASEKYISNILVCGDGDLSFSAEIAESLHERNVRLIATVLEDEETHTDVYQRSKRNKEIIIESSQHEVKFGVDATKLEEMFIDTKFDRIHFNFPHWRGKANHRYNRQLIDAFLKSASLALSDNGEIHIALCEGQGGSNCKSLQEYRDTWTPSYYASMYGLMLVDVFPYEPSYNLSSHRGVDRGFKIGKAPEMYIFAKPSDQVKLKVKEQMLCCRHELHVVLPENYDDINSDSLYSLKDFTHGDAVLEIIKNILPDGIHVEVPERRILMKEKTGYDFDMALYLIVYGGESIVLQRDQADGYRHDVECAIEQHIPLRENRRGRLVSRPFPYYLLQSIIDDHTS